MTRPHPMSTAELLVIASAIVGEFENDHPGLNIRVGLLGCRERHFIELSLPDRTPLQQRWHFLNDAYQTIGGRFEDSLDSKVVRAYDWRRLGIYLECRARVNT